MAAHRLCESDPRAHVPTTALHCSTELDGSLEFHYAARKGYCVQMQHQNIQRKRRTKPRSLWIFGCTGQTARGRTFFHSTFRCLDIIFSSSLSSHSFINYPFLTYVINYISGLAKVLRLLIKWTKEDIFLKVKKHFQPDRYDYHIYNKPHLDFIQLPVLWGGDWGPQNSFLGQVLKTWITAQLNLLWLRNIPALNASIYTVLANRWFPHLKYDENSK